MATRCLRQPGRQRCGQIGRWPLWARAGGAGTTRRRPESFRSDRRYWAKLSSRNGWVCKLAQPRVNVSKVEVACFKQLKHFCMNLHGRSAKLPSVDAKKHISGCKGDSLVAIHKRVVDGQTFHQCSRLGHDVWVVASLGSEQRRLQCAWVSHTQSAAIALHQGRVYGQYIGHGQKVSCHSLFS